MLNKAAKIIVMCFCLSSMVIFAGCSTSNTKAAFTLDVISDSYLVATANNEASGIAISTIEINDIDEIVLESDISTGTIEVAISKNDGEPITSYRMMGKQMAQIELPATNAVYSVTCQAEKATGTVEIYTVIPERGSSSSNNTQNSNLGVSISGGPDTTDELFSRDENHAKFYVFGFDKKALSTSSFEPVDVGENIQDGHFYKVVADVAFLNGGVAGYVDHPEVKKVYSVEEINPNELDISPLSGQHYYGLSTIGDYADGDILLYEYVKGVWKDGQWVYTYHDSIDLDDGRIALVTDKKKVSKEDVQSGVDSGILSCEDYFVMPLKEKK